MVKWLNDIPVGRDNAISRKELANKWAISDREMRRRIADMRAVDDGSNMVIVSVSHGGGYYRTDKLPEIEHFIAEMTKRTRNIFKAIRRARRIASRLKREQKYGEGLV